MSFHSLFVFWAIASTAITPSVSPSRPRTARLSRSPVWTDFRSLAVDAEAKKSAEDLLQGKVRVAVVALPAKDGSPAGAVVASLVRNGYEFSAHHIVVDGLTTKHIFAAIADVDSAKQTAAAHHIDELVLCHVSQGNLAVQSISLKDDTAKQLVPVGLSESEQALEAAVSQLYVQLVENTPVSLESIGPLRAMIQLQDARDKLHDSANVDDADRRKATCTEVIGLTEAVIASSPSLLEARLLRASCYDELGDDERVKQTLQDAYAIRDPNKHSRLTLLELEGDYARFVKNDVPAAMDAYLAMLEINPSNLTGLWSLIDVLVSGEVDKPTLEEAASLAARLVVSHPDSSVAQAIAEQ